MKSATVAAGYGWFLVGLLFPAAIHCRSMAEQTADAIAESP